MVLLHLLPKHDLFQNRHIGVAQLPPVVNVLADRLKVDSCFKSALERLDYNRQRAAHAYGPRKVHVDDNLVCRPALRVGQPIIIFNDLVAPMTVTDFFQLVIASLHRQAVDGVSRRILQRLIDGMMKAVVILRGSHGTVE